MTTRELIEQLVGPMPADQAEAHLGRDSLTRKLCRDFGLDHLPPIPTRTSARGRSRAAAAPVPRFIDATRPHLRRRGEGVCA